MSDIIMQAFMSGLGKCSATAAPKSIKDWAIFSKPERAKRIGKVAIGKIAKSPLALLALGFGAGSLLTGRKKEAAATIKASHPKHGRVFYAGTDKLKSSPPPKFNPKHAKESVFRTSRRREVPIVGIRAGGKTVMASAFADELDKLGYQSLYAGTSRAAGTQFGGSGVGYVPRTPGTKQRFARVSGSMSAVGGSPSLKRRPAALPGKKFKAATKIKSPVKKIAIK